MPRLTNKSPADVTRNVFCALAEEKERFEDFKPEMFSVERQFIKPLRDKCAKALKWSSKQWKAMQEKYLKKEAKGDENEEDPEDLESQDE